MIGSVVSALALLFLVGPGGAAAHTPSRHPSAERARVTIAPRAAAQRAAAKAAAARRQKVLALLALEARHQAETSPAFIWGINPGIPFIAYQQGDAAAPTADIAAMAGIGIREVRADAVWSSAATGAGSTRFTWASTDHIVSALAAAHLRWYPRLDYPPSYDSEDTLESVGGGVKTADLGELTTYAAALAARYGPNGTFWAENPSLPYVPVLDYEIWNEPNYPGSLEGPPASGASEYMRMYKAAYAGIHASQPAATVVFGALAVTGTDPVDNTEPAATWLAQSIGSDPAQHVDAVSIHAYPYKISANGLVGGVWAQVMPIRAEMRSLGLGSTPIQVTEVGFTSNTGTAGSVPADDGLSFTPAQRAAALDQVSVEMLHSNCGVDAVFPFDWNGPTSTSVLDPSYDETYEAYALTDSADDIAGQEAAGYQSAISSAWTSSLSYAGCA